MDQDKVSKLLHLMKLLSGNMNRTFDYWKQLESTNKDTGIA